MLPLIRPKGKGHVSSYMLLGVNGNWSTTWDYPRFFKDHAKRLGVWGQATAGTGWLTQHHGAISATDAPTSVFRAALANTGQDAKAGLYHIFWTGDGSVGLDGYVSTPGAWNTTGSFTYTYPGPSAYFGCYFKGNTLTSLNIVHDDDLAAWLLGDIWNQDYVSYLQGLKPLSYRFMDPNDASQNLETDWADRVLTTDISFHRIPYEYQIDLCVLIDAIPHLVLPFRCSSDYAQQLGTLLDGRLPTGKQAIIEVGNEVWNTGDPWVRNNIWAQLLNHTKLTADYTPGVSLTNFHHTGHGLVNGQSISSLMSREDYVGGVVQDWRLRGRTDLKAIVLDADNFQFSEDGVTPISVSANTYRADGLTTRQQTYCVNSETALLNAQTGYAIRCNEVWDNITLTCSKSRLKRLIGSFYLDSGVTYRILAALTTPGDVSYVAVAPYLAALSWSAKVDLSTGAAILSSVTAAAGTFHYALYLASDTPNETNVKAGTGALYSGTIAAGSNTTVVGPTFATTDGVSYKLFTWIDYGSGLPTSVVLTTTFATSATPSTIYTDASPADLVKSQQARLYDFDTTFAQHRAHIETYTPLAKLAGYEGGIGVDLTLAGHLLSGFENYTQSNELKAFYKNYVSYLAKKGFALFQHYKDIGTSTHALGLGETATTDARYLSFGSFAGRVPVPSGKLDSVRATVEVLAAPTLPYPIYVFPEKDAKGNTITYSVLDGDVRGEFGFAGNVLNLVSDTAVNWSVLSAYNLVVLATSGVDFNLDKVTVSLGSTWYTASANFAWSSIADTDNAAIDPIVGDGALTLAVGTGAAISGGLWAMSGNAYTHGSAATDDRSVPWLIAAVFDKGAQSTNYATVLQFAYGNDYVAFVYYDTNFVINAYASGSNTGKCVATMPTGKRVYWVYYDADPTNPTLHYGMNQVPYTTIAKSLAGRSMNRSVYVGTPSGTPIHQSEMGHGSMTRVYEPGLTLAGALGYVQKIQTYHGIA